MKISAHPISEWLIVTDLDGTLLDHETYAFAPAQEAIEAARSQGIPVVFCSSKTAAEIRELRRQVGLDDPFIAENGGAVYLSGEDGREQVLEIGVSVKRLMEALSAIGRDLEVSLRSIVEMPAREVAQRTGLPVEAARRARHREYSLPFVVESGSVDWEALERSAASHGLQITRGGRFAHLLGENDKGKAVRELVRCLGEGGRRRIRTVGLGDSLNDLPMLQVVDLPIRIPNPGSSAPLRGELSWAFEPGDSGPVGWNRAILAFLERYGGS